MSKVTEEPTQLTPLLSELFEKIDFAETFFTTNHTNNLEEITNLVFNNPTVLKRANIHY